MLEAKLGDDPNQSGYFLKIGTSIRNFKNSETPSNVKESRITAVNVFK